MNAQSYVERVLVLNEGYFDFSTGEILTPVTVGAYDPETETYTVLNEIENARFASDIVIYENAYYVAADKYINKYDLLTDELLASVEIEGVRKIAVDENYVVITRGEYLMEFDSYIQVLDKNNLDLVFAIPAEDENYSTEGVKIKDGIAYVAVNNGFNFGFEVGKITKINLASQELIETIDLGADGINPDNMMIDGENIYTLNNKDFSGSSVSSYHISSGSISTTNLINISSGCGTSAYFDGNVYYQGMFSTALSRFNTETSTILDDTEVGINFYGLAFDELNNLFYSGETDYFSYGKVNIFNLEGSLLHTFDVSVSPGNFAFDVRSSVGIQENKLTAINLYPNPVNDVLIIASESVLSEIIISDISGSVVYQEMSLGNNLKTIDCSKFIPGVYVIAMRSDNEIIHQTFTKQ